MSGEVSFNVSGLKELKNDLQVLGKPQLKVIEKVETVFDAAYEATQEATHIITGSLKISGKRQTDFDGKQWTGEITYGGTAPGAVFDPVDYAIYERARGGDHDFMAPAYAMEATMENTLKTLFDVVEH